MTAGALMMPTWCAFSSVTAKPHVHVEVPTLVEEMVPSTMTMYTALGVRRLADCSHNGIGVHNCYHSKDAGLVCDTLQGKLRLCLLT